MYKYKSREEVPENYKWDLSDYFKNEEEFNESFIEAKEQVETLSKYKGCTKNAKSLLEFINKESAISGVILDLYVYSYLKNDEILGIKENIERKSKTNDLLNKLEINTSFFENELLKLNNEEYNKLFEYNNLKEYKPYLDKIYRKKEHLLSEQEENIISELTSSLDNSSDISSNLLNQEHNYGTIKINGNLETITTNNYHDLMKNKDRLIRKKIYTSFNKKLNEYAKTSAGLLSSYVKGNTTIAHIHHFSSAFESKLFYLNLNKDIFKTLVKVVEDNTSSLQKYLKLRKKILGLNKMYSYDLSTDLSNNDKKYTIEDAKALIKESLKILGSDYLSKLDKIFDNRYIDYMGYKGKCSGGYSFSTPNKDSRILMSYNSCLDSVSTIIHESGHNVHHQYLKENNLKEYRNQSTIVCEVASLTNECLLSNYLLKNGKTKDEKLAGIENMIRIIRTNLFGAVREGKIEEEMYEHINDNGSSLTKEYLNDLVNKSLKKYYKDEVILKEYDSLSWITRSHYYMNFYLYSYSISICVAIKVATEILNGNTNMLKNYIKFLSTGSNYTIEDTFKVLNINLLEEDVYKTGINYFDELIKNYEKLYYNEEVK